jgi:hypothetical protein
MPPSAWLLVRAFLLGHDRAEVSSGETEQGVEKAHFSNNVYHTRNNPSVYESMNPNMD